MPDILELIAGLPRLAALRRSQHLPAATQAERARERLRAALDAAARVPFYRERLGGDPSPDDLARLPVLRREDLRALFQSVRDAHPAPGRLRPVRSSGTTGAPVELLFDGPHQRGRFAARMRYLAENGWQPQHRMAWLIGLLPGSPDGDLSRRRFLLGARFASHTDEPEAQAELLERTEPRWIYTMPSNLDAVLRALAVRGTRLRSLRGVFTGGEMLEDGLRRSVREQLGVPVFDNYGTTEAFLAWECERGSYHVNAEHVCLEVVDRDGRPVGPGETGRVLFTTLENRLMPLVRYEIGDYATAGGAGPCACGRTLPRIAGIAGRSINLFPLADGRLLSPWRLLEPLREIPRVERTQIVQHAVDRYTVRYVAGVVASADVIERLRGELVRELGVGAEIAFSQVDAIPRTGRGKYLSAVSEVAGGAAPAGSR
jgi:phenylacetate-CoA ligase